jgi:predicted ester cyclase
MASLREAENTAVVLRFLRAVEEGATGPKLRSFFAETVIQEELPNRLYPNGMRRDLSAILSSAERGQAAIRDQKYQVRSIVAAGDHVAVEMIWTGTLKVSLGNLAAGHQLRAHLSMFLDLHDGKIVALRNYDCYEPW